MEKFLHQNFFLKMGEILKQFFEEANAKPLYEVADVFRCEKTGEIKVVIKISERHCVTKLLFDVISDDNIISGLDKKTIRTLTYLCTTEKMRPSYRLLQQKFDEKNNVIFVFECISTKNKIEFSACNLINNKDFISKISTADAAKIGYYSGVFITENEFDQKNLLKNK